MSVRCWEAAGRKRAWDWLKIVQTKIVHGIRIAQLVECQTSDRKVMSMIPSRGGRKMFFSRANFQCWLLVSVCFTPLLLQWHIKDPGHCSKSACGRLCLNIYTPLTKQSWRGLTMMSRSSVGLYHGNKLAHNSSGNTCPQLSQITEPLWTDPGLMNGGSVCDLISTYKQTNKKMPLESRALFHPPASHIQPIQDKLN